jgi:hypothetical protein
MGMSTEMVSGRNSADGAGARLFGTYTVGIVE